MIPSTTFGQSVDLDPCQCLYILQAEEAVVCPWNIIISKGLHGVSLLCAALLAVSKLQLNSEYSMVHGLIYLHPLLVWLDRYVVALSTVGLLAGLFAKLVLGKYR